MDKNNSDPLSFAFKLTIADYRRMMYFNSFARQRRQTLFLGVAWVISLSIILLEKFAIIGELEEITHSCLLLVSALIPLLPLTTEFAVYRFKQNNPKELAAQRTLTLGEDGLEQARDDRKGTAFEKWSDFNCVYETTSLFIFYRSASQITLLPKRSVSPELMSDLRKLLARKALG